MEGWQAFVHEGGGKNGAVHVRAYTRTRNGKTEQVAAHSRADPPGGDTKSASESKAEQGNMAVPVRESTGITTPSSRPDVTAASPTLVIFVGGAGDGKSAIVRSFQESHTVQQDLDHRRRAYAAHDQSERIMALIAAEPPETRIVLVGHRWGGDTAAQVAAALGQQGSPVDTLITVDPVGRALPDSFFQRVRAGSREWINIRAHGAGSGNFSDFVASVGGAYGDGPRGHATRQIEVPTNHENFDGLLRSADRTGVSGFSRMLGR